MTTNIYHKYINILNLLKEIYIIFNCEYIENEKKVII